MKIRPQLSAAIELERRRRLRAEGIYGYAPRISRGYSAPRHLAPLVAELERSWREPVRCAAHAPPRHGKTETILEFIALTLETNPADSIAYVTYEANLAASKSRRVREWVTARGVSLAEDAQRVGDWYTPAGGRLFAGGVGGPLTGHGFNRIFVDDPYKNREQAESAAYRRRLIDWWGDVANTRLEPGGSIFVFHTRWTSNDLIGHILNGEDKERWRWVCMPALAEGDTPGGRAEGDPLWPDRWSAEVLASVQRAVGPYTWASLYQGRPQPRGGAVFGEPRYYDALPPGYRVGIGIDLAYSAKAKADHSVAVVLAEKEGVFYVLEVVRARLRAPAFLERLQLLRQKHPRAPVRWIASGTEAGAADFLKEAGVPLTVDNASTDKFVRSIEVAADWNGGRVLVPSGEHDWLPPFLDETAAFTGVNDLEDDQIDALAAAHRILSAPVVRLPSRLSIPRRV